MFLIYCCNLLCFFNMTLEKLLFNISKCFRFICNFFFYYLAYDVISLITPARRETGGFAYRIKIYQ